MVAYATERPVHGQVRINNELRKCGIFIFPSGIRCVWLRHQLARFKNRLSFTITRERYLHRIPKLSVAAVEKHTSPIKLQDRMVPRDVEIQVITCLAELFAL